MYFCFPQQLPLGSLSQTRFCVSPPRSPQEVNVIAAICKVGNLILKLPGSQGKAAWEHPAFSYWPSRPCQLLHFCMKRTEMGLTSVLRWAAGSGGCWGGVGNPSPVCRTEMLCKGSHLQNLGSALQKSEGKFHKETKPRSICIFNFKINFNLGF